MPSDRSFQGTTLHQYCLKKTQLNGVSAVVVQQSMILTPNHSILTLSIAHSP